MRKNITSVLLISLLLLFSATVSVTAADDKAPGFTLENHEGEPVSLADFRGYWVHLDFSADWCYWCHFQAEYMAEAERLLHDEGVDDFVSITLLSEDESGGPPSRAVLRKWVETYGIEYVLADPNVEITRLYPVRGYPTNVIVNPDGDIVEYWSGSYQTAEAFVSALRSIAPDMFE